MSSPTNSEPAKSSSSNLSYALPAGNPSAAWPIAAMQDAFLDALPKLCRDEVSHPNDVDSPNLRAINDSDSFANALKASLLAFQAQTAPGTSTSIESELASALKDSIDRLQLLINSDRHKLLDVTARDAGQRALARYAAQSMMEPT